MAFNLADFIEHTVDAVPDRTALICGDRRVTFAELEDRANRLAHHLAAQGVGEQRPRRGLLVQQHRVRRDDARRLQAAGRPDQRELPLRRGRAASTCSTTATRWRSCTRPQFCAARRRRCATGCRCCATSSRSTTARGTPLADGAVAYEDALAAASPERDFGPRTDDDLYILYTGGTTGYPKGVVWRHEDVWRTLGGGIDFVTGERIEDEHQMSRDGGGARPRRSASCSPRSCTAPRSGARSAA